MFTWETAIFNAGVSSAAAGAVGHFFGIDPFYILIVWAVLGSTSSIGYRWMGGYLPDWKSRGMAWFTGIFLALASIPLLESKLNLAGLDAGVFVIGISLLGARAIKFISVDFDLPGVLKVIINRFIERLSKDKS